ncbi:hypothetical protein F5Y10DRAFT_289054 [Nemania abortiva]|nr:hypothetical protein F5Y10DRAFT_289054 [Nemania abortiva]
MWNTRSRRKTVYLEWKGIFSTSGNSYLRKQKAIRAVVQQYRPGVLRRNPDVVKTLQSLLKDSIFESRWSAATAFPELFTSQRKPDTTAILLRPSESNIPAVFGMDEPSKELLTAFKEYPPLSPTKISLNADITVDRLYARGEYADLIVTCHGKRHLVHKAIVCPRSDFFAAACRAGMKEAHTGMIDLPDDDPQIVDMMVYYFYHLDYNTSPLDMAKDENAVLPSTDDVKEEAIDQMDADDVDDHIIALRPCYSDLLVHAKVYALAGKYFINGLKALALQKFETATQKHWAPNDFLEAAQEAYTSTPDSDRGLRDVVVKILYKNRDLLSQENTQGVLKRLDTLTYDLLMYLNQNAIYWR